MSGISETVLEAVDSMMSRSSTVEEITETLRDENPLLLEWCQKRARIALSAFLKHGLFVNDAILKDLGTHLVTAILSGYLVSEMDRSESVVDDLALVAGDSDLQENVNRSYEMFMAGELDSSFYAYQPDDELKRKYPGAYVELKKAHAAHTERVAAEAALAEQQAETEHKQEVMEAAADSSGIKEEEGQRGVLKRRTIPKKSDDDVELADPE